MSNNTAVFDMYKLMNFSEIEAFVAQKNAGSKAEYFDSLNDFVNQVPVVIRELASAAFRKDSGLFQKKIFGLQKLLLPIGATNMLWEAEKAVELAKRGDWKKCVERTDVLMSKIQRLGGKLRSARMSSGPPSRSARASSDTTIIAMAQGAGDPKRSRGTFEPQYFDKIRALIDNFETDQARSALRDLMTFSYGNSIDSILGCLYDSLAHFDQEGSERHLKRLLREIQAASGEKGEEARKKILAIDDMPEILNAIKAIAENDYAVYCVTGHKAALKCLSVNKPDLILLDIEMPDMDGLTLLEIIRKIKEYENTPVLFLTGSVTVENIVNARKAGCNDFLKKPVDGQVLMAKIKKHLE